MSTSASQLRPVAGKLGHLGPGPDTAQREFDFYYHSLGLGVKVLSPWGLGEGPNLRQLCLEARPAPQALFLRRRRQG